MATPKSPFFVVEHFLSPKMCDHISLDLGFYEPDYDVNDNPIVMKRCHDPSEEMIYNRFKPMVRSLEDYYGFIHRGMETVSFEYHSQGVSSDPHCENSNWVNKKWSRVRDRDFTGIIFLSDYQDKVPFDSEYEVFGGKLEFLQHGFGFNPQRGVLILYPSGPHFINAFSEIVAGDLLVAKFHVAAAIPYMYNPDLFPGDYKTWF